MIRLCDWDALYRANVDWALRRLEPESLEFYKDAKDDWVASLLAFAKAQSELFEKYAVCYSSGSKSKRKCIKGFDLTAEQLFELFHRHMDKQHNASARYFLFHVWNDLRYYVEGAQPELDNAYKYFKPATETEIKHARKSFRHVVDEINGEKVSHEHTFRDDADVLEYRGHRFIVDNEYGSAWAMGADGKVICFDLSWDWWYPIDEYLDLQNK